MALNSSVRFTTIAADKILQQMGVKVCNVESHVSGYGIVLLSMILYLFPFPVVLLQVILNLDLL